MTINLFLDANILLSFYALSNSDIKQLKQLKKEVRDGMKWSYKIGQSVKVYSSMKKEYRNDEKTEVFRPV